MGVLCQIIVDKPSDSVHRAGDIVSGVIKYAIINTTTFKDITLSFKGESWCSWPSEAGSNSTTHLGIDEHISQVVSLLSTSSETHIYPPGAYQQHFLFTLPKFIPPSFTQPTGQVTYKITLEFKREGLYSATRIFEVLVPVESYLDPKFPNYTPILDVEKVLFKPFSLGKQKINLKAEIDNPMVKPGDKAEIKCVITNESFVKIRSVRAELVSTSVFTSNSGATTTCTERIKECATEINKVPSSSITKLSISVPTLAEHRTVQHSRTISNDYYILVTVNLPIPLRNLKTVLPILIGEREKEEAKSKIDEIITTYKDILTEIDDPPPSYSEVMSKINENRIIGKPTNMTK